MYDESSATDANFEHAGTFDGGQLVLPKSCSSVSNGPTVEGPKFRVGRCLAKQVIVSPVDTGRAPQYLHFSFPCL